MAVTIRQANPADIPAILRIEHAARSAAHWTAQEYERLVETGFVLLREEDGTLQGFIAAREIVGEWELENVVVGAAFQRQGIADGLMRALVRHTAGQAAKAIWLEVRESNLAARALYEKHEFLKTGKRSRYYKDPEEDALTYTFQFGKEPSHTV